MQGGGAHGAYTWGVLDRLLDEKDLEIEGISGTSAGAINGAVLATGYCADGPAGAKNALEQFWRRVAWSAQSDRLTHHSASAQVFPDGAGHCRFVWIADLLPNEAAPAIAEMIEAGMRAIQQTLEKTERG